MGHPPARLRHRGDFLGKAGFLIVNSFFTGFRIIYVDYALSVRIENSLTGNFSLECYYLKKTKIETFIYQLSLTMFE